MEFKGTKSKWEVQFDTAGYPSVVYEDGNFICDVIGADIEAKANAQLIATAPKLLETLQQAIEMCDKIQFPTEQELKDFVKLGKQVIKQATKID
jgi:hypothetical protein